MMFNPGDGTGIVDEICDITQSDNNSYPIKTKTRRVNQALDRFATIALYWDKSWTFDDFNQTNLPIGTANLVSGQQDYPFYAEFLIVKNVSIMNQDGVWSELTEETDPKNTFLLPTGNSGTPTKYRLLGNSILLDFIPNYDLDRALKVVFSRNVLKFISTDTTKEPGIPSLFHPWLCQYASLPYLIEFQKGQKNDIGALISQGEESIKSFYANRNQTRKPHLGIRQENNR